MIKNGNASTPRGNRGVQAQLVATKNGESYPLRVFLGFSDRILLASSAGARGPRQREPAA